jgi:type I restriction enzyme S subunit
MNKEKVKISAFLTERKDRFKPDLANKLGLKRVKKIDFSGNIHLIEHKPTRTNMILVKKGDLLISGINAEKGGVAIYEYSEDAIATIHYSSYIYNETKINIDYLKWFLKSNAFKQILIDQAGNGIKSELKPKRFLSLEINLPSLMEQTEILKNINSFNSEGQELHNIITESEVLLSKLRQSILQDAVQGKLTQKWREQNPTVEPASDLLKKIKAEKGKLIKEKKIKKEKPLPKIKKDEIPFEIPESWMWCKLGDVINERPKNGYSPRGVEFKTQTKSLKLGATTKGVFDSTQVKYLTIEIPKDSNLWLKDGDILIQRSNSIDYVGVSAIYRGVSFDFIYPDLMMKIRCTLEAMIKYVYFSLSAPNTRKYFRENASGTSGNMPKINQGIVLNTLIPLPSLSEQKKIVEKVNQLLAHCDVLEKEIKASKTNSEKLMQSVLSKLLGEENNILVDKKPAKKAQQAPTRIIKYNSKTINMDLVTLLKENGKLHAEDLWKMSEFPTDIDKFYEELKKQIEVKATIKEGEKKGYLELV